MFLDSGLISISNNSKKKIPQREIF